MNFALMLTANREHLDRILHKVGSDYKMFLVEKGIIREMEAEQ